MLRASFLLAGAALALPAAGPASRVGIPPAAVEPVWSAKGDAIAYRSVRSPDRSDIAVALIPGGTTWTLTGGDARAHHANASWSGDGTRIAYRTIVDGPPLWKVAVSIATRDGARNGDLAVAEAPGPTCFASRDRVVVYEGFEDIGAAWADGSGRPWIVHGFSGSPVCSPNGSRVAFGAVDEDGAGFHVCTAGPLGARPRRLTNSKGADTPVAWSRDGRRILFTSTRDLYRPPHRRDALYVMNADGTREHRVAWAAEGDLSPRGTNVAFVVPGKGLFVVDADGRGTRRIVGGKGFTSPRWSPTGRWIAFVAPEATQDGTAYRIDLVRPSGFSRRTIAR